MKARYKKLIFLFALWLLGIKMVTFAVNNQDEAIQVRPANYLDKNTELASNEDEGQTEEDIILHRDLEEVNYNLLENKNFDDINHLIEAYYRAKLTCDIADFEPLVNNIDYINIKDMKRRNKYIENYDNLTCYTWEKDNEFFVVYVCCEIKFKDIDTAAPSLVRLLVKKENNVPYIYFGELNKDEEEFVSKIDHSEEVLYLAEQVNGLYEVATQNDSKLAEFRRKLEEPVG